MRYGQIVSVFDHGVAQVWDLSAERRFPAYLSDLRIRGEVRDRDIVEFELDDQESCVSSLRVIDPMKLPASVHPLVTDARSDLDDAVGDVVAAGEALQQ